MYTEKKGVLLDGLQQNPAVFLLIFFLCVFNVCSGVCVHEEGQKKTLSLYHSH